MSETNLMKKKTSSFKEHLKFLFLPGYRLKALTKRQIEYERKIPKKKFLKKLNSNLTILGVILIFLVLTFAVFGSWLSPYSYSEALSGFPGEWGPPSPEHPLGQSLRGHDVLARIIFGARSSLYIAGSSVLISVIIGTFIGLIAAYYGGWFDLFIMRIMDIILSFPGIVLAIFIITITRPIIIAPIDQSVVNIIIIFGIIGIPYFSRLIRGSVLKIREMPYIKAARVSGAGNIRIIFKHILPNCIQPIVIAITFKLGNMLISLAVLGYLGYSDFRFMDWGYDISSARVNLIQAPWASLWPSIMILITVLGFMLLGDGLRDALDPKIKI